MDLWHDADGIEVMSSDLQDTLCSYINNGGKLFIGSDSMLYSKKCTFACVIALYCKQQGVYKYYYKKHSVDSAKYKNLHAKIMNEITLSINIANEILRKFPEATIEIHADVGSSKKSKTSYMIDQIRGWILGSGFDYQIKPKSWASSSIADWHSK